MPIFAEQIALRSPHARVPVTGGFENLYIAQKSKRDRLGRSTSTSLSFQVCMPVFLDS